MLIGVLCEVVTQTSKGEKEKATVLEVQEEIEGVMAEIDEDGSGKISKKEFEYMKVCPKVTDALTSIGVEAKHLLALSDTLFETDGDEEGEESLEGGREL